MRRLALIGLLLGGLVAPAQGLRADDDEAAPHALRMTLDLRSSVDDAPETTNTFQAYVFERLSTSGIRIDSARPVGDEKTDTWIAAQGRRWEQRERGAPPASISVIGSAACQYRNAQFFNQPQAHNFHGRVDVSLTDVSGTEVARLGFEHSWGRLPQRYTQLQVQREYNDMVFTGVVLALLHQPAVWNGIPEAKRADVRAWIDEQKRRILTPLEPTMAECELAVLLRGLALPE